jgi:hypothetical protein
VETDGDTWHATPERAAPDYPRDNSVASAGWSVLRFNGQQIRESAQEYCLPLIAELGQRLGGLSQDGLIPRQFQATPDGLVQQLTLLEDGPEFDV